MKKLFLIVLLAVLGTQNVNASHVLGGEIRWECLSNGRFVFFAKLYRDCTGIPINYNNLTLDIVGNPLPQSANNASFSSIVMKPDSNTWTNNRNGDTSPTCAPGGETITCPARDPGSVQQFFYQSDPIIMKGVPPSNGWKFFMQIVCCRPNVTNLAAGGTMMLRATMFPNKQRTNTQVCFDSSPEFLALPTNLICRGYEFTYNHTAIDKDLDSLVYGWDRTYNVPPVAPQPVPYANGYNFNNPTPDKSFNNLNIPASLDPISGQMKVAVYSGVGSLDYLTVIRVDAWREGRIIASVFREVPFVFFDCPRLPSGQINKKPEIFINGDSADGVIVDIVAGQRVKIPIQVQDLDVSAGFPGLQKITLEPAGILFSKDLQDTANCQTSLLAPCAILRNQRPTWNSVAEPPRWEVAGYLGIATEFIWDPGCQHISTSGTGIPGQNVGIYNFVMRVYDDHCPIPAINYPTITVRVRDPFPLTEPIMKGVSVGLDGRLTYSWVAPIDSAKTFHAYDPKIARVLKGQAPTIWQAIRNNVLKRYKSSQRNTTYPIFNTVPGNPNKLNVFDKIQGQDYYLRMNTLSGCTDDAASVPSQPAQVMDLQVVPSGNPPTIPLKSEAQLTWNAPKQPNANSYPYFTYESRTKYYIWTNEEFNATTGAGIDVNSNWVERGSTYNLSQELPSTSCFGVVAFRVEARDTVITWRQGAPPPRIKDSLDTLYYSTFSVIDTMLMVNPGILPSPVLDTLEVLANGNVKFRINTEALNVGTAGLWRIYANSISPANLLDSIVKPNDSIILTTVNNGSTIGNYVIEAVDACNPNNLSTSNVYNTKLLSGKLPDTLCLPIYILNWNIPSGFANPIAGYRVYRRVKDTSLTFGPWELITTVNNGNTDSARVPRNRNTDYIFKVEAFDASGAVNISSQHTYLRRNDRTFEVVKAPELRCSYVEDDGSVTLSFIPADPSINPKWDSTGNWVQYQFEYRSNNGPWITFPNSALVAQSDDSVRITGINALNTVYQFRATTESGCSGTEKAPYSTIDLIVPTATAVVGDENKEVEVSWTDNGLGDNPQPDFVYVSYNQNLNGVFDQDGLVGRVEDVDPNSVFDVNNKNFCDTINTYHIIKMDQLSGCMNRSMPDTARVIDQIPPPVQLIDRVTYFSMVAPAEDFIRVYWTWDQATDIDSLIFFHPDLSTGQNQILSKEAVDVTPAGGLRFVDIPQSDLDASDSARVISVQTQDACGRLSTAFNEFDYHKTIDLEMEWDPCDSVFIFNWNAYNYFHSDSTTIYQLQFMAIVNGVWTAQQNFPLTVDTTFRIGVIAEGEYSFRVLSAPFLTSTSVISSNLESDIALFNPVPAFNYMHYVTVNPTKEVALQVYKDNAIKVGGYSIMRGSTVDDMVQVGNLGPNDLETILEFEDLNVETDDRSYIYRIVVENQCGNPIDTTNVGTSIHLMVDAQSDALQNVLTWNEYQGWDSAVTAYNIYRGVNGNGANTLYATVPAENNSGIMQYVDDVFTNSYVRGDFCYRVEAIQGPINPQYEPELSSATSNSNEVCVTQEPKFYVPNAFAPDGINKVFGPSGQFFDFSRYEMIIYNRWGELVYETRDINKGWDGTRDGDIVPVGSYVYTIRFVDADGSEHRRKGTVTVIK